MEFVVITGMSGAGKSQAVKCLEDVGFFCVDNLPPTLIPTFAELCLQSEKRIDRVALVVDVREGEFLGDLSRTLEDLKKEGHFVQVIFLDASDEALIRRFSETRRPHPLALSGVVPDGIRVERELLASLKARADLIIDTSPLTVHELRKLLFNTFLDFHPKAPKTAFSFVSFGYKFGLPYESDLVFDVRVLPNPHFVQELKPLTGQDLPVADYLLGFPQTRAFLEKIVDFIRFALPLYIQEGKAYLTIAIGCTGGQHRSVFIAEELAKTLRQDGYEVSVRHRDIAKEV